MRGPPFSLRRGNSLTRGSAQYSPFRTCLTPSRRAGARGPSLCLSQLRPDFLYLFFYALPFHFVPYQSHL